MAPTPSPSLPTGGRQESPAASATEPQRTCVGCRQVKPKSQLHRLGMAGGILVLNPRPVFGRTAYLCADQGCWAAAEKRRLIDRALQVHLTAGDWARLRQGILS